MNTHAALAFLLACFVCSECQTETITCYANEEVGDPCQNPDTPCPFTQAVSGRGDDEICSPGCVCKRGFVRTVLGECVTQKQCDRCKDKESEVFMTCGTACPLVCNETYPESCTLQCVLDCFCLPGYIRSSENGPCVPIQGCPPSCKNDDTMVYTTCRSRCPPTCNEEPKPCTKECVGGGCVCREGYLRLSAQNDTCVTEENCPPPS